MNIDTMIITPEVASAYLESNTANRKLAKRNLTELSEAMKAGKWVFNGDPIRISKTGVLLDGQHRLSAVVKSGMPQKFVVMTGLDDDVFKTIDTGKKRNAADALFIAGYAQNNNIPATVAMYINYQNTGDPVSSIFAKPSNADIIDCADSNKVLVDAVSKVESKKRLKAFAPVSSWAFCYYIFGCYDSVLRDSFFDEFVSGEYSQKNSPVSVLKETLMMSKLTSSTRKQKRKMLACMFRAFKYYCEDRSVKNIRLLSDDSQWFQL